MSLVFPESRRDLPSCYSPKEQKYAHFIGQASWAGARIIQGQWTPQAQSLYDLLILTFSKDGKLADLAKLKADSGVSEKEWFDLLQYTAQVCRGDNCIV